MLRLSRIIFLLMASALLTNAQRSPNPVHTVYGKITDTTGAVINGLRLALDNDKDYYVTDINGEFKFDIPAGDHIITIDPQSMYDFRAFIRITASGPNPDNLELIFDMSRVCCAGSSGIPFPKPSSLPKPVYPAAARAVRAGGEVIVDVSVDRDGKVVNATAMNGHPLLRAAALKAARDSRFATSDVEDRNVRLIYVFEPGSEKQRDGIKRHSNPYRIEIVSDVVILDTMDNKNHVY